MLRSANEGSLRKVGLVRLILTLFDATDYPEAEESPHMAITPMSARPGTVDTDSGPIQPLTDQERRARSEALGRALDEIAGMTDETDTDQVWQDVMRGIDENRPHRPQFEGSY